MGDGIAPPPSMAAALDHAAGRRMRAFHAFGIGAPLVAIVAAFALGGDPVLRAVFCVGMAVLAASNVGQLLAMRRGMADDAPFPIAMWVIGGLGCVPAAVYFGPYSGAVMIYLLAITVVAVGRRGVVSALVVAIAIASHLAMTVPLMLGAASDSGILSSDRMTAGQRVIAEALLIALLASGYAIGRWVRRTGVESLRELEQARRDLGDQKQALAEIRLDVAREKRWNEGRWSGERLGAWKLGVVLGRGAMGEVYEAFADDGREAAIKLLAPREITHSLVERFHRELAVVAKLESPYIVRVLEVSPPDAQVPYLVMERLRGSDLATELKRVQRLPLPAVVEMLEQIARGLEVARVANVVHRDLKPHNLFCHDGRWKILDFGVAKVIGSEGTLTGDAVIGTPQYMAPEQATDRPGVTVSHRADVYALGAIAYRCLTGRTPFSGTDVAAILYQVVHMPPARPSSFASIPRAVEDVLAVAMAKDPAARFETAVAFVDHLAVAAATRAPVALAVPAHAWNAF